MDKAKLEERRARKKAEAKLAKIQKEKNQKEVTKIRFSIEWKKSAMWGYNPNLEASVWFKDGSFEISQTYKCSGYGYDKLSTVVAQCFNDYLKYRLYDESLINAEKKPYGVHCGEYKYYDGGIGINCYKRISEFIGGTFETVASGKTYDCYEFAMNEIETQGG